MNTGAPQPTLLIEEAEARVLGIQTKLHRWATDDPDRRFADLFNLVCDPAVLLVAWRRVKGNKGARTAGWTARPSPTSSSDAARSRFSPRCAPTCERGRFARYRSGSG